MDEILIDEKKYVSSKQAAKLTGYAKDYIGQLCREGRVPARLVGRSWYVLESAIQDHRFGLPAAEEQSKKASPSKANMPWAHESPRYEAAPVEILPTMQNAKKAALEAADEEGVPETQESLQNSWKAWFDRVGSAISASTEQDLEQREASEPEIIEQPEEIEPVVEDTAVNIPIHTIRSSIPMEISPRYIEAEPEEEKVEVPEEEVYPINKAKVGNRARVNTFKILGVVFATVTALTALIGSGYVDNFLKSTVSLTEVSGLSVYNK